MMTSEFKSSQLSVVEELIESGRKSGRGGAMVWMLGQNDEQATKWYARSQDGVRQYEVWADGLRPRQAWHIRYSKAISSGDVSNTHISNKDGNREITELQHIFRNEWECKNAAEVVEAGYPLDKEALADERKHLDAIMTRGGKKWEFYGVVDNKQIWAYRPNGAKHAYVIIFDYKNPQFGWTVSVRTWFKSGGSIRRLKIETLANCTSLEQAQDAILRLTSS
jgi:hypothetical protein